MKKRMQTFLPTLLVLAFFLFSGFNGLQAQTLNTSPVVLEGPGKTTVEYMQGMDAINTLRAEMQSNFDLQNPPQDENTQAARVAIYKFRYMVSIQDLIGTGSETGVAIVRSYNDILNLTKDKYPGLVDESWLTDMVTLLSI